MFGWSAAVVSNEAHCTVDSDNWPVLVAGPSNADVNSRSSSSSSSRFVERITRRL